MKTLYLIRHAKSSWSYDVDDHQRPLKDRGINDSISTGKVLKEKIPSIDLIISSDAVRAKSTAYLIVKELGIDKDEIQLQPEMYDFSGGNVLEIIKSCSDEVNSLMLFGHNHAFTALVNTLGDKTIDNLPTAGVAAIQFNESKWSQITSGKTLFTIFPKEIR